MICLLVLNAIFDFAGLATIGALILSALDANIFEGTSYVRGAEEGEIIFLFNSGLRKLYDLSGVDNHISFLFYLSILIFLVFIIKNAISLYIGYLQSRFAYNVSLRLNKKMFKYFYDQGYLFIKDSATGKKVYSIVDVPMRFASHYLNTILVFGTEILVLLIIAIALLIINPVAVLLLGATILPTFFLIYQFTQKKAKEIGYQRNELAPQNYGKVLDAMNGFVDVKLGNLENKMISRYLNIQKKLNYVDVLYYGIYQRLNQRTNDIIFGMGILVIFGFAHFTGMTTETVLSLLGLFAIAAYKFLPSINRMIASLLTLKNSSFVIDELNKVQHTSLTEYPEAKTLTLEQYLELKNISFQYPNSNQLVLDRISLTIKKGETIGIIGSSGSGKTTILKILLRLIKEDAGGIFIDGIQVNQENESGFQKLIGYVEQEIFIINDSLLNNVAFGEEHPNLDKVWRCLKEAQLEAFVKSHKEGVELKLGENGVNLSGGQKQRVGIARALYKDAQLLIFDEATSALDSETEKAVVHSINHLSQLGKTIVIVAHRITTLEKCDRIFELQNGKIIREPEYKQLIKEKVR